MSVGALLRSQAAGVDLCPSRIECGPDGRVVRLYGKWRVQMDPHYVSGCAITGAVCQSVTFPLTGPLIISTRFQPRPLCAIQRRALNIDTLGLCNWLQFCGMRLSPRSLWVGRVGRAYSIPPADSVTTPATDKKRFFRPPRCVSRRFGRAKIWRRLWPAALARRFRQLPFLLGII